MKIKLIILLLCNTALLLACSCISQGQTNLKVTANIKEQIEGEKLLNERQLQNLSNVTRITLFDMEEGTQKSKLNRTLSSSEIEAFLPFLLGAVKDTTLKVNRKKRYAHKLEVASGTYILSLFIYEDLKQLKLGDINGVLITGVDNNFMESIKEMKANE